MARADRGERKRLRRRARDERGAGEASAPRDLTDIVGDHLIPEQQRGATTNWHPSRRGASPHHSG
jgi:hypothetical protein